MKLNFLKTIYFLYVFINFQGCRYKENTIANASLNTEGSPNTKCPWTKNEDLIVSSLDKIITDSRIVSVQDIRQDLDCLKAVLSKSYAGAYHYQQQGISFPERLDSLSAALTHDLSLTELLEQLIKIHDGAPDSHLSYSFVLPEDQVKRAQPEYSIYHSKQRFIRVGKNFIATDNPALIIQSCERADPAPLLEGNGSHDKFIFVGQSDGDVPNLLNCRNANNDPIALSMTQLKTDELPIEANSFHFEVLSGNIVYARFPTMTLGISSAQSDLLASIRSQEIDRPLIFDLRQNGGGDDSVVYEIAKAVLPKNQRLPKHLAIESESLYSSAALFNNLFLLMQIDIIRQADPEQISNDRLKVNTAHKKFKSQIDQGYTFDDFSIATHSESPPQGEREHPYSKPIVLLVDKNCASSCETFVELLGDLPNVVVIGSHSKGLLHFGNVGVTLLPNSKIIFSGGITEYQYSNDAPEGIGYTPTFYSVDGDSLKDALAYLKLLAP
jgi:hypothetical protein